MKTMQLEDLREKIDRVDTLLLKIIAKRQEIVKMIADIKKKENLEIFQPEREKQLIVKRMELAADLDVDPKFVFNLFQKILENSRQIQEEI